MGWELGYPQLLRYAGHFLASLKPDLFYPKKVILGPGGMIWPA
jgi:hypothetical protein